MNSLVLLGRARTGSYTPTYSVEDGENPYELEMRLLDDLKPGEVPVLGCGGPTERIAPWGELLTTATHRARRGRLRHRRAGPRRPDDPRAEASRSSTAASARSTAAAAAGWSRWTGRCNAPASAVRSGDVVFGDVDGVVVVPQGIEDEVFRRRSRR